MSKSRYLFAPMHRASIAKQFPLDRVLLVDIDPDDTFYSRNGPGEFESRLDAASNGLTKSNVTVLGKYPCMKGEDRKDTTVIVLDGEGADRKVIKGITDLVAGPDFFPEKDAINSYVCQIDEA